MKVGYMITWKNLSGNVSRKTLERPLQYSTFPHRDPDGRKTCSKPQNGLNWLFLDISRDSNFRLIFWCLANRFYQLFAKIDVFGRFSVIFVEFLLQISRIWGHFLRFSSQKGQFLQNVKLKASVGLTHLRVNSIGFGLLEVGAPRWVCGFFALSPFFEIFSRFLVENGAKNGHFLPFLT